MTDNSQSDAPDQISWSSSSIIIQQAVSAIVAIAAIFGVVLGPDKPALIGAGLSTTFTLIMSAMTMWHRLHRPCPPIVPKAQMKPNQL
jgi:hypothetical protein